jgi:serine O-acetyltransferase
VRVPTSRAGLMWQMLRLTLISDAFGAQVAYRLRCRLRALGVPVIPWVLHRASMVWAQVCIGNPVVIEPGLYLPHGQVVVDGIVRVGSDVVLFPWVTVGLVAGTFHGPTIGAGVHVGSGARVLGPITLGAGARVGANAVVLSDVDAGTTVVGMPAAPRT